MPCAHPAIIDNPKPPNAAVHKCGAEICQHGWIFLRILQSEVHLMAINFMHWVLAHLCYSSNFKKFLMWVNLYWKRKSNYCKLFDSVCTLDSKPALHRYVLVVAFKTSLPAMIICICFFFGRMQCSWTDLMIESCYSEKMKDVPGPNVWRVDFDGWCLREANSCLTMRKVSLVPLGTVQICQTPLWCVCHPRGYPGCGTWHTQRVVFSPPQRKQGFSWKALGSPEYSYGTFLGSPIVFTNFFVFPDKFLWSHTCLPF